MREPGVKSYSIGVIGIGKITQDQHLPVIAKDARFKLAGLVSQAGLVGGPARNIDPERHLHGQILLRGSRQWPAFRHLEEARTRHSLTGIRPAAGHRVLNRALPSSAAPPPAP